jgi:hypothetical protein
MFNTTSRVLDGYIYNADNQMHVEMTVELCLVVCNERGYQYAGLEDSYQCFCGDTINPNVQPDPDLSQCAYACPGSTQEQCGGFWRVLVLNFTCSGPPTGGAPMALMTPCQDENGLSDTWNWEWAALSNPMVGSSICLGDWPTHCLAAEATHEHSQLVVTRNADKWYYDASDNSLNLLPDKLFRININCAFEDKCVHNGANLLLSRPQSTSTGQANMFTVYREGSLTGQIRSAVSEGPPVDPVNGPACLSMGCFTRGQGLANVGGNCAIWSNVSDPQACQQYCQDVGEMRTSFQFHVDHFI